MRFQISQGSRERLGARLVVASTSGGKDSTALALALLENEIPHVRVFADTGFEAPETYEYLDLLRGRLGPIEVVRNGALWQDALPGEEGMLTLIRRKKMFPSRLMRFCTQQLKVFPIRDYLRTLQDRGEDVVSAVGVRADESTARSKMSEWEFWDEIDAEVWRPILHWTEQDVIDMHRRHGIPPNPLYLKGARRVGCLPCIHARKQDIRLIPPEQLAKIRRVETELTEDAVARGRERPTRAFFQVRGPEGLRFTPIDEVVRLAHLHRGRPVDVGREPPGCVRWGMCDATGDDAQVPAPDNLPAAAARPAAVPDTSTGTIAASEPPQRPGHNEILAAPTPPAREGEMERQLGALRRQIDAYEAELAVRLAQAEADLAALRDELRQRQRPPPSDETTAPAQSEQAPGTHGAARPTEGAAAQPSVTAELPPASQDPPPAPEPAVRDAEALDSGTSPSSSSLPASNEVHPRLRVVPCTITQARAFIAKHHRHLAPPVSGLFAVGVARGDQFVGVAMVGRPVARALQDGSTVEVTRVCTLGDRNACSMLLSACRRSAAALGYRRVVTYTLASEPGTSLRAAGWREVGRVRGRSWNCAARPRADQPRHDKRRWEAPALPANRPPTHKENRHVDA